MEFLLPSAGLALALTWIATPLLRELLHRAQILDHPNEDHKAHDRPAPSLGGAAVVVAVAAAMWFSGASPAWGAGVYAACAGVFLLGVLDDLRGASPWAKLSAEVVCAGWVCAAGMTLPLGPAWIAVPATMAWLAACANGFNLTDGADGLATMVGAVSAAGLCAIALTAGHISLAVLTGVLAAALFGFLFFNFPPASIFLGDSGSLTAGFALGVAGVAWARVTPDAVAATAPLFALALPLLETVLSATRRSLRGDPVFRADRRHIHHRLVARGLKPAQVTLVCGLYSLIGAVTGGIVAQFGVSSVSSIAAAVFAGVTVAGVQWLDYAELRCAAITLVRGPRPWPLAQQIRAVELRQALELAEDPEERWRRVDVAMREMGFRAVRLLDGEGTPVRQTSKVKRLDHVWKLTVALPSGEGVIEAERAPGDRPDEPVPDVLADTLRQAFAETAPAAPVSPNTRERAAS